MFQEITAGKKSLSQRRLIYGVGINDAWYMTTITIAGKRIKCPYYKTWRNMLRRCYSIAFQDKNPTYKDCTVDEEWHTLSKFRLWMDEQDWEGKHLDKDIMFLGNTVYASDRCVFVTPYINSILLKPRCSKGMYSVGVGYKASSKRFIANCSVRGRLEYLGYFDTAKEASEAYKRFKYAHVIDVANQQKDIRIKAGLIKHADILVR